MTQTKRKIAFMFPGQGSQFLGMGEGFLAASPEARTLLAWAEAASGMPLGKLIQEGPMEELTRAQVLQPAITVVNLICWQALFKAGVRPDYVIGHSLGEYSALCAAGILSVADTLTLVAERGRLMGREGEVHVGGMRVVLGLALEEVAEELRRLPASAGTVVVANHNTPQQIVVSGDIPGLDAATAILSARGAKVIPLNVSIANHSPLVAGAVDDFAAAMENLTFMPPTVPLLFNVSGEAEQEPAAMRALMASHLCSMVLWVDTLQSLINSGVDTFIEVGPKTVLSGILKKTLGRGAEQTCYHVEDPTTLAACLHGLAGHAKG
jgi:[acyl-carrier-protein] S-malonyltransferase